MRYVSLGRGGPDVSVVALGCGNFGVVGSLPELFGLGENEEQAHELLDAAHESGITLLDTANSYGGGRSEDWLGRWLSSRGVRDEMVITTKVGNAVGPAATDQGLSATHIRTQIEASLRRLRTDRIDLYLTHAPDPATPLEGTIAAFGELIEAGKIRYYGLSNVDGVELAAAVAAAGRVGLPAPVNLQIGHSLLEPAEQSTLDSCVGNGVGVTAFSPLAGGWLARDYQPGQRYPAGSRMALRPQPYHAIEQLAAAGLIDTLRAEAGRRGLSLPTMALAWALSDPAVSAAIIGARTPDQLAPAIAAADHPLNPADRTTLAALTHR